MAAGREGRPPPPEPRRGLRPALRGGAGVAAVLVVAVAVLAPAPAEASDVGLAADWLESAQNVDGGFGPSQGDASSAEITCWAMLGLEAAGRNPLDVSQGGSTPVDFLRRRVGELASPGDLSRTILALQGAGVDPRNFGGQNLVSRLLSRRRDNGSYEDWPNSTAYAVIALRTAGAGGTEKSLSWLRSVQNDDGGWGDTPGSPSNADGTGAVLQALSPDSKASAQGLSYLRRTQHKGGGYALGGSGGVNTQSTAWAIQGILAAGGDPGSFRRGGFSAPEYLTNNQQPDGSYRYAKPSAEVSDEVAHQTPVWVTAEVMVAAGNEYLPISPPPRKPKAAQAAPAPFGGITPEDVPAPESTPVSPAPAEAGGGGSSLKDLKKLVPPGKATPVAPAGGSPPAKEEKKGAGGVASETSTLIEKDSGSGADSSAVGAILAGLAAGALLFGAAWAGRRGWMRWRYGL